MGTKGKMWVDKDMIWIDWRGEWRIVHVHAESETSVWIDSRVPGAPPRVKHKRSSDGSFYETTPDGYDAARARLAEKAESTRKAAAHAANQLHTMILKISSIYRQGQEPDPDARLQDAKEETLKLARMQEDGEDMA